MKSQKPEFLRPASFGAGRIFFFVVIMMEYRIAILRLIVQDRESSGEVNQLLHEYGDCIIGRMGIPRRGQCSIITVVLECPNDTINALSGKLGRLKNVQVKSMMAK